MLDFGLFGVMNQPPWDTEVGDKYIIHYTYGCYYDMKVNISNSDLTFKNKRQKIINTNLITEISMSLLT